MATATATALSSSEPTLRERVVDAARRVSHLSHEASLLKSLATDAVEDSLYKTRRAVKTARRDVADAVDEAAHRIKQAPLASIGVTFGVGVCVGVAVTSLVWLAVRSVRRTHA